MKFRRASYRHATPCRGGHTEDVLGRIGIAGARLEELRVKEVL